MPCSSDAKSSFEVLFDQWALFMESTHWHFSRRPRLCPGSLHSALEGHRAEQKALGKGSSGKPYKGNIPSRAGLSFHEPWLTLASHRGTFQAPPTGTHPKCLVGHIKAGSHPD